MSKSLQKLWLFGKHAVVAALNNPNRRHTKLLITKALADELAPILTKTKINPSIVTTVQIEQVLPKGSIHQGIALETSSVIIDGIESIDLNKPNMCYIILDQISDQTNIGGILRTAAAFDIDGVITLADNTPTETGHIAKAASGALEIVPLIRVVNLVQTLKHLQNNGFWSVGLDSNTNTHLHELDLPNRTIFIMGSEHSGLRRLTKDKCDYLAKIAMSEKMESLNVGVAAALTMQSYYMKFKNL